MPFIRVGDLTVHVKMAKPRQRGCRAAVTRHGFASQCGCTAELLCDWPVGTNGRTCSAPICNDHATEIGPGQHLCPVHAAARRRQPQLFP